MIILTVSHMKKNKFIVFLLLMKSDYLVLSQLVEGDCHVYDQVKDKEIY